MVGLAQSESQRDVDSDEVAGTWYILTSADHNIGTCFLPSQEQDFLSLTYFDSTNQQNQLRRLNRR